MDTSNFKGTRIRSQYDGAGSIDYISEGSIGSIKVSFDNGSKKSFRIPIAFNSKLLSSDDEILNRYIDSLNSTNNAFILSHHHQVELNSDIPNFLFEFSPAHDGGLTQQRLALLGALDDFIRLYTDINRFIGQHISKHSPLSFPQSIDSQIERMIEPLLNKYLYIFTNEYDKLLIIPSAFDELLNYYHINFRAVTFEKFYTFIQNIYLTSILKLTEIVHPDIPSTETSYWIIARIQMLSDIQKKKLLISNSMLYTQTNEVLYVMKSLSSTSCYQLNHSIVSKSYFAPLINTGKYVSLPVHYCTICNRYFIGDITLQEYEKCYGKFLVMKRFYTDSSTFSTTSFDNFHIESLLHQYGYNVRANVLSDIERHQLLVKLIDSQELSYHEICRTIEQNVHLFQGNLQYSQAVSKWKSDLKFIGDYVKSKS